MTDSNFLIAKKKDKRLLLLFQLNSILITL